MFVHSTSLSMVQNIRNRLIFYNMFNICLNDLKKIIIFILFTEQDLIDSLPFSIQCPDNEVEFVKFLYENRLKKVSGVKKLFYYVGLCCISVF